ncbi:SRPBCC family protein [Pedobacter sp. MW01-1-1]|uniref:SRPBCC family protein n=1 Tax=Pedobacter sp. MW01-1-1 TaxID=3383027 RepID=UPI003FF12833
MKFLKILLGIIVALAVIIIIGSFFMPNTYSVSRSISINAPDSVVYQNIGDFNQFTKWDAWTKMEPSAKMTNTGTPMQPNHTHAWEGEKMGSGQMKIIKVEPYKEIDIELKFIKPFESIADTKFTIEPEPSGSKVTWTMSGKNNMISKWMCLFMGGMDGMIGKDFESGLQGLKELSEKGG